MVATESHPVWGAWIEIIKISFVNLCNNSRTPCGVRGLKYAYGADAHEYFGVAPRVGCVD